MPIKGMTPEITEKTATRLEETGHDVLTLVEDTQAKIVDLDWSGEDRDTCVARYEDEVLAIARTVRDALRGLAEQAESNAQHQRVASTT